MNKTQPRRNGRFTEASTDFGALVARSVDAPSGRKRKNNRDPITREISDRMLIRVGLNVRMLRLARGLTYTQFQNRSGMSGSTLWKLEHGKGSVDFGTIAYLAYWFKVPICRLTEPPYKRCKEHG